MDIYIYRENHKQRDLILTSWKSVSEVVSCFTFSNFAVCSFRREIILLYVFYDAKSDGKFCFVLYGR